MACDREWPAARPTATTARARSPLADDNRSGVQAKYSQKISSELYK
jgi:hypothetical protein